MHVPYPLDSPPNASSISLIVPLGYQNMISRRARSAIGLFRFPQFSGGLIISGGLSLGWQTTLSRIIHECFHCACLPVPGTADRRRRRCTEQQIASSEQLAATSTRPGAGDQFPASSYWLLAIRLRLPLRSFVTNLRESCGLVPISPIKRPATDLFPSTFRSSPFREYRPEWDRSILQLSGR